MTSEASSKAPEAFNIEGVEDALNLLNEAPKNIPCLVEGMITREGLTMLAAKPKTGKTSLVTQLMVDVAEGRPFLGSKTECADILYLYLEGPKAYPGRRFAKLGYTGTRGKIQIYRKKLGPKGIENVQGLVNYLHQNRNIKMVVVDTWAKLARIKDSHKYDEAMPALEMLEKAAQFFHIQIVCVHHSKKKSGEEAGDSILGSTAIRAGTDTNIFLTRQGDQRIIETEHRELDALPPHQLNLDPDTGILSLGKPMDEVEEEKREAGKKATRLRIEKTITDALFNEGTLSQSEVRKRVEGRAETVLAVLKDMEANKKVSVVEQENGAKLYSMAEIPTAKVETPFVLKDNEKKAA